MRYMLDTNICIYVQKAKHQQLLERFWKHYDEGLCISVVTLAELLHGVEKSSNIQKNFIALKDLLDFL